VLNEEVEPLFTMSNFIFCMEELTKDIQNYLTNYYKFKIGPIPGINKIEMNEPAFIGQGYE
jgi:hypothetical protein